MDSPDNLNGWQKDLKTALIDEKLGYVESLFGITYSNVIARNVVGPSRLSLMQHF
jgi:hypothetical protein